MRNNNNAAGTYLSAPSASHISGGKYWHYNRHIKTVMSTICPVDDEQLSFVRRTMANRTHDDEVMVHWQQTNSRASCTLKTSRWVTEYEDIRLTGVSCSWVSGSSNKSERCDWRIWSMARLQFSLRHSQICRLSHTKTFKKKAWGRSAAELNYVVGN